MQPGLKTLVGPGEEQPNPKLEEQSPCHWKGAWLIRPFLWCSLNKLWEGCWRAERFIEKSRSLKSPQITITFCPGVQRPSRERKRKFSETMDNSKLLLNTWVHMLGYLCLPWTKSKKAVYFEIKMTYSKYLWEDGKVYFLTSTPHCVQVCTSLV